MKIVGAVLVVAFVLLLDQTDAVVVEFARMCRSHHVSHGFRKDIWQPKAIHYCFPSRAKTTTCQILDATKGINCTEYGPNYHLQGGLDNRQAKCCERTGMTLHNCSVQPKVFSHKRGFDMMYFERVLRQLISIESRADFTSFEIELCTPKYITSPLTGVLPPLPPTDW